MAEADQTAPSPVAATATDLEHFGDDQHTPVVPAPWVLTGQGVIVLLRDRARQPANRGLFGRFSLVMFVDYLTSDVGPYQELLHIPRVERWPDVVGGTVGAIWVTSQASALNGNANWGLTKSVADIRRERIGGGRPERWTASDEGGPLAEFVHQPWGLPFPAAKPRNFAKLVQRRDACSWVTPVGMVAKARLSSVWDLWLDPERLVDTDRHVPVGAVQMVSGRLDFHASRIRATR